MESIVENYAKIQNLLRSTKVKIKKVFCSHTYGETFRYSYYLVRVTVNGNDKYYLNGYDSTKEELNKTYLDCKHTNEYKFEVSEYEKTLHDVIEYFMRGYDSNVDYIDDGRQWQIVNNRNKEVVRQCNDLKYLVGIEP